MPPHPLILWTIRVALACFAIYFAGLIARHKWAEDWRGRLIWTAGCLIFIVHVFFAFKYRHDWSYQAAVEHTAEATNRLLGVRFGQGILFSYVFMFVWLGDVVWWWASAEQRAARPWWAGALIYGYMIFIAINGAIIFESGVTRPAGILVCIGYALLGAWTWFSAAEPKKVPAA